MTLKILITLRRIAISPTASGAIILAMMIWIISPIPCENSRSENFHASEEKMSFLPSIYLLLKKVLILYTA